jgi:hypothetical protein
MAIDHESPFKELRLKNRRIMVSHLAGAARPSPSYISFCSPEPCHSRFLFLPAKKITFFFFFCSFPLLLATNAYLRAAMAAAMP